MPTYAYRCDTCGHAFDAVQRFADDPLRECPECGAAIRRVIQPVGVVFKGSGWYITDSRATPKDEAAAKKTDGKTDDAAAKPADGTAGDAKGDTKKDGAAAKPSADAPAAASKDGEPKPKAAPAKSAAAD